MEGGIEIEVRDYQYNCFLICWPLGDAYFMLSQFDSAINDYTKTLEINPNDAVALNNRAASFHDRKKYSEALIDYNRALQLHPSYSNCLFNRGQLHFKLGLYNEAITDFTKSYEISGRRLSAILFRGLAYCKVKNS